MNVIPFKENREMHVVSLSRETTEVAFAYFAKELSVRFQTEKHRDLLVNRSYRNLHEIKTSLSRYKVFKDLAPIK